MFLFSLYKDGVERTVQTVRHAVDLFDDPHIRESAEDCLSDTEMLERCESFPNEDEYGGDDALLELWWLEESGGVRGKVSIKDAFCGSFDYGPVCFLDGAEIPLRFWQRVMTQRVLPEVVMPDDEWNELSDPAGVSLLLSEEQEAGTSKWHQKQVLMFALGPGAELVKDLLDLEGKLVGKIVLGPAAEAAVRVAPIAALQTFVEKVREGATHLADLCWQRPAKSLLEEVTYCHAGDDACLSNQRCWLKILDEYGEAAFDGFEYDSPNEVPHHDLRMLASSIRLRDSLSR